MCEVATFSDKNEVHREAFQSLSSFTWALMQAHQGSYCESPVRALLCSCSPPNTAETLGPSCVAGGQHMKWGREGFLERYGLGPSAGNLVGYYSIPKPGSIDTGSHGDTDHPWSGQVVTITWNACMVLKMFSSLLGETF